jgi:hypothetical protein
VEATLLRAPGALFQRTADGIENLYTLKLVNKTSQALPVTLRLESPAGKLKVMGAGALTVPKEQLVATSVLVELSPGVLTGHNTKLRIGVYANGKRLSTVDTIFAGPREEGVPGPH